MPERRAIGHRGQTHSVEFRVRYAECDAFGYLHHARYWEYFEVVRTELLRVNGFRYRDLEREGVFFVVYKLACTYLKPIRYDDLVTVMCEVTRISRTRVDHRYEVFVAGEKTSEAETILVCVGRDGRPMLMPDQLWEQAAGEH
jgi:acyl-CoA thioester hydrolase